MTTQSNDLSARMGSMEERLTSLEKTVHLQTSQYTEIKVEMGVQAAAITGLREQAKAHNESQSRANADLRNEMVSGNRNTQDQLALVARELQGGLDKLISATGLDEDPKAAGRLRKNLSHLGEMMEEKARDMRAIKHAVIVAIVSAVLIAIWFGIHHMVNAPLPK